MTESNDSSHGVRQPTLRRTFFRKIAAVQNFVLDLSLRELIALVAGTLRIRRHRNPATGREP